MFEEEYKQKMKQLREKQAVTDMIPPVPQQNPGRRMPWGEREFPELPPGAVSQKLMSSMCPPTGHIWNNWKGRGWAAHLEAETKTEFPRISEPWDKNAPGNRATDPQSLEKGRQEAGRIVLRRPWRQYCKWKVIELSDCPVKNLCTEGATLADGSEEESDEEASEDDDDDDEEDDV